MGRRVPRFDLIVHSLYANISSVYEGMAIEWGIKAIRDMRRLAARDRERIIAKIEQYASDPVSLGMQVVILTGGKNRRLRVGNYRVIFNIEHGEATTMAILRVLHRSKAYD